MGLFSKLKGVVDVAGSMVPGVEVYRNLKRGNFKGALVAAAFDATLFIPGVGVAGRIAKGARAVRSARKARKAAGITQAAKKGGRRMPIPGLGKVGKAMRSVGKRAKRGRGKTSKRRGTTPTAGRGSPWAGQQRQGGGMFGGGGNGQRVTQAQVRAEHGRRLSNTEFYEAYGYVPAPRRRRRSGEDKMDKFQNQLIKILARGK